MVSGEISAGVADDNGVRMTFVVGYEPEGESSSDQGEILADIRYGTSHERWTATPWRLVVGLEPVARSDQPFPAREVWRVQRVTGSGWDDGIGYVEGHDLLFAHGIIGDEGSDLSTPADALFTRLLRLASDHGYPHPLRMWSFLPSIHREVGGLERYRGFCVGRESAFRAAGLEASHFPAGTAIGSSAPGLLVYCLAVKRPGRPVENPRQVSAYCYPSCYGPRSPSFARAVQLPGQGRCRLLVSGTAAVVGHRSCHPGDIQAQMAETLVNLESLARAAGLDGCWQDQARSPLLKVFLREPSSIDQVAAGLHDWSGGRARVLYLKGEVCRQELDIEIEGVV